MLSNNVKIVQNGRFANVFIDGIQVRGIVSIDYHIDMKSIGTVKLEFFSQDIEIEINEVKQEE